MVALNKNGTSKDIVLKQIEFNNRYNELIKEEQNNKEKSTELTEMENKLNKLYKLLDNRYMDIKERTADDFYVIRLNEISKD
jgi:DNA-directed RNA polymerase specialized sigma54-like protein